jgi:hypothetical protein
MKRMCQVKDECMCPHRDFRCRRKSRRQAIPTNSAIEQSTCKC